MGPAHYDLEVPVNKGMSGILALTEAVNYDYRDCIRCSKCVDACPMGLIPSRISILAESKEYLETKNANVMDCMECGVCTYVCPARRPIVHWIKVCKGELARERARQKQF
jgi:electron transport complex protein RnfC